MLCNDQLSPALTVKNLSTRFHTRAGTIYAVNGVNFELPQNRCLALIGESGAGKSVTALSILRMIPRPGRIASGEIRMNGDNLLTKTGSQMRKLRGKELSIMFQDPLAALNPVITVGDQIRETIQSHRQVAKKTAEEMALAKLDALKLPARRAYNSFPFQLSGGMRQRAALALALILHPQVLIADEPTSFLDVTLQGQILAQLKHELDQCCLSLLFITHDLAAAATVADRVAVMYGGIIVEEGSMREVFGHPLHPYTRALLRSHPAFCRNGRLEPVAGSAPVITESFSGCPFRQRCSEAEPVCIEVVPDLSDRGGGRLAACHKLPQPAEQIINRSC